MEQYDSCGKACSQLSQVISGGIARKIWVRKRVLEV